MGGNVLYYPGCLTKFASKELEDNYKKILKKIGIDFIQLKDMEVCCGSPVLNSGHKKEAIDLAQKNLNIFKQHSVIKIITSCPACFKTFSKDYPKLLKEWNNVIVSYLSLVRQEYRNWYLFIILKNIH